MTSALSGRRFGAGYLAVGLVVEAGTDVVGVEVPAGVDLVGDGSDVVCGVGADVAG